GSVTLRDIFPNPQHVLLPGMFVRERIDEGIMNDAILAPQQGITRDVKGDATALVVDAANKVEQRTVETGDTYGDKPNSATPKNARNSCISSGVPWN
ncbi:HlyD family secretion protein, partial [Klebsiella pneumoniae]|uniref:HlyD family secretion protein n=1 Tax=Klebsiella pneumoniae TaxID=573 RepID=UPI002273E1F9